MISIKKTKMFSSRFNLLIASLYTNWIILLVSSWSSVYFWMLQMRPTFDCKNEIIFSDVFKIITLATLNSSWSRWIIAIFLSSSLSICYSPKKNLSKDLKTYLKWINNCWFVVEAKRASYYKNLWLLLVKQRNIKISKENFEFKLKSYYLLLFNQSSV